MNRRRSPDRSWKANTEQTVWTNGAMTVRKANRPDDAFPYTGEFDGDPVVYKDNSRPRRFRTLDRAQLAVEDEASRAMSAINSGG